MSKLSQSIKKNFDLVSLNNNLMTDKDKNGLSMKEWNKNEKSDKFSYKKLKELNLF